MGQAEYIEMKREDQYRAVPESILKMAFQPTARGGKKHFIAGNIRLVSEARELLDHTLREKAAAKPWMVAFILESNGEGDEWEAWLEEKYHIDPNGRGDIHEEQLLIEDQEMFVCPICHGANFL